MKGQQGIGRNTTQLVVKRAIPLTTDDTDSTEETNNSEGNAIIREA